MPDSKNLSNQLKSGVLRGVFIPTEEHEQFTTLARHRKVTKKLTNQITYQKYVTVSWNKSSRRV
jgi:hypothetical protein